MWVITNQKKNKQYDKKQKLRVETDSSESEILQEEEFYTFVLKQEKTK